MLGFASSVGGGILQMLVSIILAAVLLANGEACGGAVRLLVSRIAGT